LSTDLELADHGQSLVLLSPEQAGGIEFTNLNPEFQKPSDSLACAQWDPRSEGFESILGRPLPVPGVSIAPAPLVSKTDYGFRVHYDVLGLTYWMLARVEEIDAPGEYFGDHQRILGTASHAFRHRYLERPIVDEWMHVLRQLIGRQWPHIKVVNRQPRTLVSCDVDHPFEFILSTSEVVRRSLEDIFRRNNWQSFFRRLFAVGDARKGIYNRDSFAQGVEYIMDVNEQFGNSVVFYFITLQTDIRDGFVNLADRRLGTMLQRIHSRGHEIGIHPGYLTYQSPDRFRQSVKIFRDLIRDAGIHQPEFGGRQHYLRWETPQTAKLYAENGLAHDSTMGYADRAGFRCGTCWEYPMFDHQSQQELNVMQRPLVLMDDTVINKRYMGLGYTDQALEYMCRLRETCRRVSGDFTLLWHNTYFRNARDKEFYETLIA
jgi:hypothetical protein